jgi:hypothetical protein
MSYGRALRRYGDVGDTLTPAEAAHCTVNEWYDTANNACVPFGGPNAVPPPPGASIGTAPASMLSSLTSSPIFIPAVIGVGIVAFMMLKKKRTPAKANPSRRRRRRSRRRR